MRAKQRRASEQASSGARYGLFVAFDQGMQVLIDALVERVGDRLELGCPVESIERHREGWRVGDLDCDAVLLALPAWRSARILRPHHDELADALDSIRYGSAATVTMAWPRDAVGHALDAFGFVVPSVERRSILASTFSSVKWPGRAPEGQVLLRVFIGGANAPDSTDLDDDTLSALARRELARVLDVKAEPTFSIGIRYRRAMPQYQLRHRLRVDAIEAMQNELPTLRLAGNAYRGVGIPDTIAYAQRAADALLQGPRA